MFKAFSPKFITLLIFPLIIHFWARWKIQHETRLPIEFLKTETKIQVIRRALEKVLI